MAYILLGKNKNILINSNQITFISKTWNEEEKKYHTKINFACENQSITITYNSFEEILEKIVTASNCDWSK